MASSAFKSTTRRALHGSADRPAAHKQPPPPPCPRRSRSVAPAPRRGSRALEDFAASATRTNPLFVGRGTSASSPPPPPTSGASAGERGREEARRGGRGSGTGRVRSASVAPPQRRRPAASSAGSVAGGGGGGRGRASRARSAAEEDPERPCRRGSETDVETRDVSSKMRSWRSPDSAPGSSHVSVNAISQRSHSTVPVLEIPPEFDPDSAEFASDMSDYATEFRRDFVEIPLEFDPDASELVSDKSYNALKLQWEQMEIPHDFDPDSAELAPDITEYTSKLKQSHERARKLRADLAVEEQREQELSRMLKGIVTVPSLSEAHKRRPKRKGSIERLRVSRHLAEEAMSYFEECVSISTLDSTDFSSLEEPQPTSVGTAPQKSNSRFLLKGGSSFLEPHILSDRLSYHEESDNQTQCSMSITGSDVSDSVIFSHAKSLGLGTRINSSDDLESVDTPQSRSSCFSFSHGTANTVDNSDVQQYLRSFSRGISKERSSYCADDYAIQKISEDILADTATFKNRIEYGGLLLCNIRTF